MYLQFEGIKKIEGQSGQCENHFRCSHLSRFDRSYEEHFSLRKGVSTYNQYWVYQHTISIK